MEYCQRDRRLAAAGVETFPPGCLSFRIIVWFVIAAAAAP